ncbi:hypothetical protein BJ322DRAFT_1053301 [Thelephora terrestris]|uniref:Uncharacterized protein n=1 Tax=Thelephora terrestris TaxID=56493 RepID=A0A9P6HGZ1_9AGAM|nr:hypothetical protein BJ322DRAFT_1053301 [Thelephora terrestris]
MGRSLFLSEVPAISPSLPPLHPPTSPQIPTLDPAQNPANTTSTEGQSTPVAPTPVATTFFENYALAQSSLRQTAQSLDVAFERLRELRRVLVTYQQAMAAHTTRGPAVEPNTDFGPPHSALVLTDSTSDDSASAANPDPPLYVTATPLQWPEMSPFRFINRPPAVPYDRQNGSASPLDDNRTPIPPSQTRSSPLSNDSSTTLARRLAARQNPSSRHRSQILGSVIDILRSSRTMENPAPLVDLLPDMEASSRSRVVEILRQRRESHQRSVPIQPDHSRQSYTWEDDDREDRSRSYRVRRRLNADGDELVQTVNLEPESPRSVEPLWDVPRRRRFPIAPTPPTVDDSYRERQREVNRPEVIVFSRVNNSSDSEPHSVPVNSRRPPSRRRGWARLDPDGNEISTDEEEIIERARMITRRNNPQPFFNLFRPVVRASSDSNTTSRDDTNASEAQTPARSDRTNTVHAFDTTTAKAENTHGYESNDDFQIDYINPLPMPLDEMVCNSSKRTEPSRCNVKRKSPRRVVRVSPSAQLAGR